jgi:hypothetical protein
MAVKGSLLLPSTLGIGGASAAVGWTRRHRFGHAGGLRSHPAVTSFSPWPDLVLEPDLQQRLSAVAAAEGVSLQTLCERWLRERLERQGCAPDGEPEAAGRCSVRTGHSAIGPVPLPLQQ